MSKITSFFKQVKKNSNNDITEDNAESENICEQRTFAELFYEKCLTAQEHACNNIECINIKAALQLELRTMQERNRNVKAAIQICTEIVADKDIEIQNLMQKTSVAANVDVGAKLIPVGERNNEVSAECVDPPEKSSIELFSKFQNNFNPDRLSYLRSICSKPEKDSHFVHNAVQALYEGQLKVLKNISVTGRSAGKVKEKMSSQKHAILTNIYTERIMIATQNSAERVVRQKKLNKYIKDAIRSISKAYNDEECQKTTCENTLSDE